MKLMFSVVLLLLVGLIHAEEIKEGKRDKEPKSSMATDSNILDFKQMKACLC